MKYVPSYIVWCWRQVILQEFFFLGLLLGYCSNTDNFVFRHYSHYNGDILKFHYLLYEGVFCGRVAHNPTSEVVKQKTDPPSWRWEPPLPCGVQKSSTPAPKFCFLLRTHVGGTEDALKVFPPPVPQSTVAGSCRLPALRCLTVWSFSMASHHTHPTPEFLLQQLPVAWNALR